MKKRRVEVSKYLAAFLFIWGVFVLPEVFAQGDQAWSCSSNVTRWVDLMYNLQHFFSWIWIILANLVGRLMTNAFIYGEFIGLDAFLWKMWQISRNIANFAIGFYFLYTLLKFLLFPSEKDKNPKEIIKTSLVAGILIQASWFIVMVIVDISSILFATASSLPSQVVANNSYLQKSLEASLEGKRNSDNQVRNNDPLHYRSKGKVVKLYVGVDEVLKLLKSPNTKQLSDGLAIEIVDKSDGSSAPTQEEIFDMILPRHDSLSGPLMFLGLSMFRTTDFVSKGEHKGVNCVDTTLKEVIIYLLHRGMVIVYTLSLFVLLIVLIGRVAYLWVFIALSPIVFLLRYLKVIKTGDEIFWDLEKMIKLIFQPVLFALFIGIMMLVLVTLSALFQSGADKDLGWAFQITSSEWSSILSVPGVLEVGLRNTALTFEHLMLGGISLLFMWLLVKMAAETKTGIKSLDDLATNITKFAQKAVMTTPLIPTPVGKIGLGSIYDPSTWANILDKIGDKWTMYFTSRSDKETSKVMEMFGIKWDNKGLGNQYALKLQQIAKTPDTNAFDNYKVVIRDAMKTRSVGFADISPTLYDVLRSPYINYWNSSLKNIKSVIDSFTKSEDAKAYFESDKNYNHFKILYKEVFGTDKGMPSIGNINNRSYKIFWENSN